MQHAEFTTRGLSAEKQLEAWQSWYGSVFETSLLQPAHQGFDARNRAWNLRGLALNHVSAPGLSVVRTKSLIRREPIDHWAITLGKRSFTDISSGNSYLRAPPAVPFVLSLGREMQNRRDADERIQLYLPRDSYSGIAALLDASCMTALETPGGKLLADYMCLLVRNLPRLDHDEASQLIDATRSMIAACLAPTVGRIATARPAINATLIERVRQAVRRHLRSPMLGPDMICREAATSRSQLYRLLESEGGVGRYIRKLRLSEAFSLLCENSQDLTISSVAEVLCFSDASSFARAFRDEFGVSPSDVRAAAQAGTSPVPTPASADDCSNNSFVACLRRG